MSTKSFFATTSNGTIYRTGRIPIDSRILYDPQWQRWIACTLDMVGNSASRQVILAVSSNASPTNLRTVSLELGFAGRIIRAIAISTQVDGDPVS